MKTELNTDPSFDPSLTLEDLMASESSVLARLAEEFSISDDATMASHFSSTSGHNSNGQHTSHTSAMQEKIL